MNPADMFDVYSRLGETNTPLLDERAHRPHATEEPLFLKEDHARTGTES